MVDHRAFIDLEGSRGTASRGSYNRRWNAQLVQGLVELGALRRHQVVVEDVSELPDEVNRRPDWASVELRRADLGDAAFWSEHWTPWQRQESIRSRQALDAVISLAHGSVRACEAIAQSYRPNDQTYRLFGRAADQVEPLVPCGRCPGCRHDGILPQADPPPRPVQAWPLPDDLTPRLDDLAEAAAAQDRLVILVSDNHDRVAYSLARALVRRGVRHLAGPTGWAMQDRDWLFVDPSPVTPADLTPCSSFVVYPATTRVSATWLSPRARYVQRDEALPAFDVLLVTPDTKVGVRSVGRDLPALDALTALQVLGG